MSFISKKEEYLYRFACSDAGTQLLGISIDECYMNEYEEQVMAYGIISVVISKFGISEEDFLRHYEWYKHARRVARMERLQYGDA